VAQNQNDDGNYGIFVRRLLIAVTVTLLFALILIWRIDNPRVERMRAAVVEAIVPNFEWALVPVTGLARMGEDFASYARLYEQNQQLRRELQQMEAWREAALQLEQENARLLDLNNVRLDPELTFVTGVVTADSGTSFRRSVILNIGARDSIREGLAAMDGLGLVGRIAGISPTTARVLLLTDSASNVPVTVQPSGQRALLQGDNSSAPVLEFVENPEQVRPGDRVVSSGDGGVFPDGLLVGRVALGRDGRLRVRLSADYERLEFLRVLRTTPGPQIGEAAPLFPPQTVQAPVVPPQPDPEQSGDG
jgi:rod shape-determining protein MreC